MGVGFPFAHESVLAAAGAESPVGRSTNLSTFHPKRESTHSHSSSNSLSPRNHQIRGGSQRHQRKRAVTAVRGIPTLSLTAAQIPLKRKRKQKRRYKSNGLDRVFISRLAARQHDHQYIVLSVSIPAFPGLRVQTLQTRYQHQSLHFPSKA